MDDWHKGLVSFRILTHREKLFILFLRWLVRATAGRLFNDTSCLSLCCWVGSGSPLCFPSCGGQTGSTLTGQQGLDFAREIKLNHRWPRWLALAGSFWNSQLILSFKKEKCVPHCLLFFQISTSRSARVFFATQFFKALSQPPCPLPCLLRMILGQRCSISICRPCESPLSLNRGPYVYENDTQQECLLHAKMSLSFLIAPIYEHVSLCLC